MNSSVKKQKHIRRNRCGGFSVVETVVAMVVTVMLTAVGIAACYTALKIQNNAVNSERVSTICNEFINAFYSTNTDKDYYNNWNGLNGEKNGFQGALNDFDGAFTAYLRFALGEKIAKPQLSDSGKGYLNWKGETDPQGSVPEYFQYSGTMTYTYSKGGATVVAVIAITRDGSVGENEEMTLTHTMTVTGKVTGLSKALEYDSITREIVLKGDNTSNTDNTSNSGGGES